MKKIVLVSIVSLVCCSALSGCGVVELTDRQSAMIAQYAADALLEYDVQYKTKLQSTEFVKKLESTTEKIIEVTEQEINSTTEIDDSQNQISNKIDKNDKDISNILDISGLTVKYMNYEILDSYPKLSSNDLDVQLNARSGNELLVIKFKLKNNSNKSLKINLIDKQVNYKLSLNNSSLISPLFTILLDDMQNIEASLDKDEQTTAVLIYEINKSLVSNISSLKLEVSNSKTSKTIYLK